MAEWAPRHDSHPNPITDGKTPRLERAAQVCDGGPPVAAPDLKTLHAKMGALTWENDCLESALTQAGLLSAKR